MGFHTTSGLTEKPLNSLTDLLTNREKLYDSLKALASSNTKIEFTLKIKIKFLKRLFIMKEAYDNAATCNSLTKQHYVSII